MKQESDKNALEVKRMEEEMKQMRRTMSQMQSTLTVEEEKNRLLLAELNNINRIQSQSHLQLQLQPQPQPQSQSQPQPQSQSQPQPQSQSQPQPQPPIHSQPNQLKSQPQGSTKGWQTINVNLTESEMITLQMRRKINERNERIETLLNEVSQHTQRMTLLPMK
jgi:hypothetical protein